MKKVNIKDVAKEAKVSVSTVSRVINNSAPVSGELKSRVIEAIKKLGYKPSHIARGLRSGKTKTIGFIIPDITNPFFPEIVRGVEDYLRKKDYTLILCNSDQDPKIESELVDILIDKHIDGLLFTGAGEKSEKLELAVKKGLKVVFLDRIIEGVNASYVVSDNYDGMKSLLEYLWKAGYRSFYFINGSKETFSARIRYKAFLDFVEKYRVKDYHHIFSSFSYEAGYNHTKEINRIPDVIIGGNDLIAYGVIDALEEMGLDVPDDVGVTGFDDILFSKHYKPSLTTVRQPMYEMGKKAAQMLIALIEKGVNKIKGYVLPTEVVIRNSTQ
ncbi:MAG: LacI family DNA-binding transcriptional regulator [Thermotogaceae bacterium]|nr:LacI family DNA-binding transcriptional regulator [Thermotogaceae bacterium]